MQVLTSLMEGIMPAAPGRSHALYAQATFVQLRHGDMVLTTTVFAVSLPSVFMESSIPVCDRARVPLRGMPLLRATSFTSLLWCIGPVQVPVRPCCGQG